VVVTFPYIFYIIPQFGSSPPLFSLGPLTLLKMASSGFDVSYSYMCQKYINHIHPPLPSSFTLLLPLVPFPYHDLFYFLSFVV
jgi:hypothetical protein